MKFIVKIWGLGLGDWGLGIGEMYDRLEKKLQAGFHCVKLKIGAIDFDRELELVRHIRAENPNVKKIYSKYHDQGLEIISISLDAKLDPWKQAIEKDQLPWIHISDLKGWNSVVTDVYEIHAIPQLFILDADNRILAEGLRGEELEKFIASLFK